jgi:uncharacterized protein YjaZ
MAFDNIFERKKLVKDLKYLLKILESQGNSIRNGILTMYSKRVEIILNALKEAKERKLSDIDARDLLYLAHLKALEAIQPMIEKLNAKFKNSTVTMNAMLSRYNARIIEIGEGWGKTGNGK